MSQSPPDDDGIKCAPDASNSEINRSARFLNRVASVPEPQMRVALWKEHFQQEDPKLVLATLDALMESARVRKPLARSGILSFTRFLQRNRVLAKQTLLPIAAMSGHTTALALLVEEPPLKEVSEEEKERAAAKEDRETTLGERRSLARRPDPSVLDRLLSDPDPMVIQNALSNPRIVEPQVVRLASKRPIASDILTEVFQHARWGLRPQVQLALVQNPYTPLEIALGLLPLMSRTDVLRLQREPSIHPLLRGWAKDLVDSDKGKGKLL